MGEERRHGQVLFERLKAQMDVPADAFSIDSASVKVHPDGMGRNPLENLVEDGIQKFICLLPRIAKQGSSRCRREMRTMRLRNASYYDGWEVDGGSKHRC